MIKLLAVDMDGTCLDGRSRITDHTLLALREAAGKGITVVRLPDAICSACPTGSLKVLCTAPGRRMTGKTKACSGM